MAQAITTIEEVKAAHAGAHIQSFDAGRNEDGVRVYDTIVWASEEDAANDDGSNAIARYVTDAAI